MGKYRPLKKRCGILLKNSKFFYSFIVIMIENDWKFCLLFYNWKKKFVIPIKVYQGLIFNSYIKHIIFFSWGSGEPVLATHFLMDVELEFYLVLGVLRQKMCSKPVKFLTKIRFDFCGFFLFFITTNNWQSHSKVYEGNNIYFLPPVVNEKYVALYIIELKFTDNVL